MYNKIIQALEFIQKGEWEKAHEIAQSQEGNYDFDRIHALLHRIEGDEWNAKYWYSRCKTNVPKISTEEEAVELLEHYRSF